MITSIKVYHVHGCHVVPCTTDWIGPGCIGVKFSHPFEDFEHPTEQKKEFSCFFVLVFTPNLYLRSKKMYHVQAHNAVGNVVLFLFKYVEKRPKTMKKGGKVRKNSRNNGIFCWLLMLLITSIKLYHVRGCHVVPCTTEWIGPGCIGAKCFHHFEDFVHHFGKTWIN